MYIQLEVSKGQGRSWKLLKVSRETCLQESQSFLKLLSDKVFIDICKRFHVASKMSKVYF